MRGQQKADTSLPHRTQRPSSQNHPHRIRRLIYFIYIISAVVLVSFYGGVVPYLLFYFAILLPLLSLSYTFYVFIRFKIVQEVERVVVKAQELPYRLILANEDPIPFTNITLRFFSDMVHVKTEGTGDLSLLSHEHIRVDTKMYCKYRGTYPVGVKSVEVTDFLKLFTIAYPMTSQIRLTARPRVIPLEQLRVRLQEKDPKNNRFSVNKLQNLPDYDLRSYIPGDPRKYIHWKNSAKAGELLVRRQLPEEQFEMVLIMDLFPPEGTHFVRLQAEDNIMEASLSFIHDYYLKKIPVRVVYMQQSITEVIVDARHGFEPFYDRCADLQFISKEPLSDVFTHYRKQALRDCAYILITSSVNKSLKACVDQGRILGHEILLINTGELPL